MVSYDMTAFEFEQRPPSRSMSTLLMLVAPPNRLPMAA